MATTVPELPELQSRVEALMPEVERIVQALADRIKVLVVSDEVIASDPEIANVKDSLLAQLEDIGNLRFALQRNHRGVPTVDEYSSYLGCLAVNMPRGASVSRVPVSPNYIEQPCAFDRILHDLSPEDYRKLVEFEIFDELAKIKGRMENPPNGYNMTYRGGPSGNWTADKLGIPGVLGDSFSQAEIDPVLLETAEGVFWVLARCQEGKDIRGTFQPFKKVHPDFRRQAMDRRR